MAKRVYNTPYNVTFRAYRFTGPLYNEFNVKRRFDNIFHLKYYLKHYKDTYNEDFVILRVVRKEVDYDYEN